jgi:hypothetical protein
MDPVVFITELESDSILEGKLYRYVDDQVNLPLIEIKEADLDRLEGYDFFEPSWVIAEEPVQYAIFDRDNKVIFSFGKYANDYSADALVAADGYDSAEEFRKKNPTPQLKTAVRDMDIWIRMGLSAKIYLPSLKRKH